MISLRRTVKVPSLKKSHILLQYELFHKKRLSVYHDFFLFQAITGCSLILLAVVTQDE